MSRLGIFLGSLLCGSVNKLLLLLLLLLFHFFETSSLYVAQTGLELEIPLPQSPECWDFRLVPPCPSNILFPMTI
jgi:hypothetical protein